MATNDQDINLKLEILPKSTSKAFAHLTQQVWINKNGWYLAGGTALALQMGHRLSVDLDFFTTEDDFNIENLISSLTPQGWVTSLREKGTLYGELNNTKISFISYPYFSPKEPFVRYGNINILDSKDIAVMKVIAISQRGRKRDFIDLYWYSKNKESLADIIKRIGEQYPNVEHSYHHILKSLTYFDEADVDPNPQLLLPISWDEVKLYFLGQIPQLGQQLL